MGSAPRDPGRPRRHRARRPGCRSAVSDARRRRRRWPCANVNGGRSSSSPVRRARANANSSEPAVANATHAMRTSAMSNGDVPVGERRGRRREARTAGRQRAAGGRHDRGRQRTAGCVGPGWRGVGGGRRGRLHAGRRSRTAGVSFGSDVVSGARVWRGFGVAFGGALVGLAVGFGFGVGLGRRLRGRLRLRRGLGRRLRGDRHVDRERRGRAAGEDHPWIRGGQTRGELVRPGPRRADRALSRVGDRRRTRGRRRLAG